MLNHQLQLPRPPESLSIPVSSEFSIKKCLYLKKKKLKGMLVILIRCIFPFLIWGSEERSDCEGGQGEVSQ